MDIRITPEMLAQAQATGKTGRVNRKPSHDFFMRTRPWAIQPFVIAPVLAGETMKNALLQSRAVSDPIKAPLIGWHLEYYLFYVKLRDLDVRNQLTEMILTPGYNMAPLLAADYQERYQTLKGQLPWVKWCLDRVVAEYFRDEGDGNPLIDTLPAATFQTKPNYLDSAKLESAVPVQEDGLPGTDAHAPDIPAGFEAHYAQWEHMRALKLIGDATFEDYLATFGVKTPAAVLAEDDHKPELIRYVRDWAYPSNTVDPSTGVPNSVLSWSVSERADKDRFFKEPGFLFGVTVTRPKVYLGNTHGNAVAMLNDTFAWLPALMSADPFTSLKRFTPQAGPLGHPDNVASSPTEAYWVDARDLFLYGDQMSNMWADAANDQNVVMAPRANLQRRFATDAEATSLFAFAERTRIRQDGVIQFTIAGTQVDHT